MPHATQVHKPGVGTRGVGWAAKTVRGLDEMAERAKLDNISAPELKLMKFLSLTTNRELRQKICKLCVIPGQI